MKDVRRQLRATLLLLTLTACDRLPPATAVASSDAARHPLDPLTVDEIRAAAQSMRGDSRLVAAACPLITLQEPPKPAVLAWKAGQSITRQARAVAMPGSSVFEVVIDIAS